MHWLKAGAVAVAAFVFFQVVFHGPLNMSSDDALMGAFAATVLAVFPWTRLAAKFHL
jgi:hypothetical protein